MIFVLLKKELDMALTKEFQFYIDNQQELTANYKNKFIVIVGEEVVGDYDNISDAYTESKKTYDLGTFFIKKTGLGKENYTQVINRCSF